MDTLGYETSDFDEDLFYISESPPFEAEIDFEEPESQVLDVILMDEDPVIQEEAYSSFEEDSPCGESDDESNNRFCEPSISSHGNHGSNTPSYLQRNHTSFRGSSPQLCLTAF